MILGQLIYGTITADDTLAELVGQRVYPAVWPEGPKTFPFIVYEVQGATPIHVARFVRSLAAIRCYDTTYIGANTVAEAVASLFRNFHGNLTDAEGETLHAFCTVLEVADGEYVAEMQPPAYEANAFINFWYQDNNIG